MENQKAYTLTANKVEAVDAKVGALVETKKEFKAFDASLPTVEEIIVVGPKKIAIRFSEPLDKAKGGKVEIKKGNTIVPVNSTKMDISGNQVTVDVFTAFTEGGEYKVTVSNFTDFAGYKNIVKEEMITFAKDTTAPTATVTSYDSSKVVVEFSKPVMGLKPEMFWHSYTAWNPKLFKADGKTPLASADLVSKAVLKFYMKEGDKALPEGNVKFGINGEKIVDLWGNKLGMFEEVLAVKSDNTKPEVTAEKVADKAIKFTFTKDVTAEKKHFTVVDKDGKNVPFVFNQLSLTEYEVRFLSGMQNKTVTVSVKNVVDRTPAENKMVPFEQAFEFGDMTAPTMKKVAIKAKDVAKSEPAMLYVFFSEALDGTAQDVSNYQLADGNTFSRLTGGAEFYQSPEIVRIILSDKEYAIASKVGVKLLATNIKDASGIALKNNLSGTFEIYGNATKPAVVKNILEAKNVYRVVFDQNIESVDVTKFKLQKPTVDQDSSVKFKSYEVVDGNSVRLTLEGDSVITGWDTESDTDAMLQPYLEEGAVTGVFGSMNAAVAMKHNPASDEEKAQHLFVDAIKTVITETVKDKNDGITFDTKAAEFTLNFNRQLANNSAKAQLIAANDIEVLIDGAKVEPADLTVGMQDNQKNFTVTIVGDSAKKIKTSKTVSISSTDVLMYITSETGVKVSKFTKSFELPRVVGISVATVEGKKEVTVMFDTDMGVNAIDATKYTVTAGGAQFKYDVSKSDKKKVVLQVTGGTLADGGFTIDENVLDANGMKLANPEWKIKVTGDVIEFTIK